jgi:hypothetical protein
MLAKKGRRMPMRRWRLTLLILSCLLLPRCSPAPIYAPIEPAYDANGNLRTDGHYVRDDFMRKMSDDLKACRK